jgi:hypothetical protein
LRLGSSISVMDMVQFSSSISLRSWCRYGSMMSIF